MAETYTIYDLARDCGVSVATISRVINGSDNVSAKTREKVQQAMKAHNYTPNIFARGMNKMATSIIAVFISDIANPFFADIVKGIEETCRKYEYRIILCITNNDMEQERKELELMMQKQVDGFIICGSRPLHDTNAGYLQELSEKMPVIMVNSRLDGGKKLYSVLVDEKKATEEALSTLFAKQHYKHLYLFGDDVWQTTKDKTEAAEEFCAKLGIPLNKEHRFHCPHTLEGGLTTARAFLQSKPQTPALIFCVSDQIAIGVLKTLSESGIHIGKDIGVLGFSDISLCQLVTPALTTVNQRMKNLGEQAANLFVSQTNGIVLEEKVFYSDYELIERESTV
ncbi:MAG: LacI family transcriptional regulator [Treponema sp.]|nr:LacI family transcriptional regulator [Treponema sp.]